MNQKRGTLAVRLLNIGGRKNGSDREEEESRLRCEVCEFGELGGRKVRMSAKAFPVAEVSQKCAWLTPNRAAPGAWERIVPVVFRCHRAWAQVFAEAWSAVAMGLSRIVPRGPSFRGELARSIARPA